MSTLYIGLDDTDTLTSPGTGHLARDLARILAERWLLLGITRHQLLQDDRVPMTAKNSANVIHLEIDASTLDLADLADEVANLMLARFQPGSDPGLCLVISPPPAVIDFGRRAQLSLIAKEEARDLADTYQVLLRELGGTGGGIIGALAAAGLAATGNDGRFTWVGAIRDLTGVLPVEAILSAGVDGVQTLEGQTLSRGLVDTGDKVRPALIGGRPVLLVEPAGQQWRAVRRD